MRRVVISAYGHLCLLLCVHMWVCGCVGVLGVCSYGACVFMGVHVGVCKGVCVCFAMHLSEISLSLYTFVHV